MSTDQLEQVRVSLLAASETLIAAQEMRTFWLGERTIAFVDDLLDDDEERGQARLVECEGKVAEYQTLISDLEARISDLEARISDLEDLEALEYVSFLLMEENERSLSWN
jgi:cell division protein FtsB